MKTVYIDNDCKVHMSYAEDRTPIQTDVFEGKCQYWIEGHRYVPENHLWTRSDGIVFLSDGVMVTPWKPYSELEEAQREYERQLIGESVPLSDLTAAYQEGVNAAYDQ